MKKRDIIKQKNKLKAVKNYRYLKLAKYACILLIILFLIYVGGIANLSRTSFEELLSKNAIVITGFMICTANLYIWYALKTFLRDLGDYRHIESIRMNLILMAAGQFILMNFISSILIILSLKKYFQWNQFSVKKSLQEIRKDGQSAVLIVTALVLVLFVSLVFGLYFSIAS